MRGFVTIVTGKEAYYRLAHNLLLSYRYHAKSQMPFAILCDQHNRWTEDFDEVVIISNPAYSYFDKMRILDLSPFDETIFIDADCLLFRDPNSLWSLFKNGPDVGVLGATIPLDSDKGWWDVEDLGELKNRVDYKMTIQGGIYYVRNSGKDIPAFIETCRLIEEHYLDYHFRMFEDSYSDEMIISLACCVHHYKPAKDWVDVFAFYPEVKFLAMDILSGALEFEWIKFPDHRYKDSLLIHFSTTFARNRWQYKKEVFKLKRGPIRFSNCGEYCLLRMSHIRKKILSTLFRLLGNERRDVLDIYS